MFLDPYFEQAGKSMGIPLGHLKIAFSIFMTYPQAFLFNQLPNNPTIKHVYSIVLTCATMLWFNKLYAGFAHLMASAIITYILTKYWKDKRMPWVNFAVLMAHMSFRWVTYFVMPPSFGVKHVLQSFYGDWGEQSQLKNTNQNYQSHPTSETRPTWRRGF
jgi:hypothetical protein